MRMFLVLLTCLVVSPTYAQRVFRASVKIDDVQNERLDAVEAKVDSLNETVKVLAQTVNTLAEVQKQRIEVSKAELQVQVAAKPQPQAKVVSYAAAPSHTQEIAPTPKAASNLAAIAWQAYPDGVYRVRYADVQPRSQVWNHLIQHGFSRTEVEGLSQFEALAIHDLAHGGKVRPGQGMQQPMVAPQPAKQPVVQYANYDAGCANGQCTRQGVSYSYSRPRLFGLFR